MLKTEEDRAEVEATSSTATFTIDRGNREHTYIAAAPSIQYSPIDRLPTELLLCIFHYCNSQVKHRLRLTHVCGHWREIAIASGSLWTSIDITLASNSNEQFHNFTSLLDLQLVRTQDLPLDVVWHATDDYNRTIMVIVHINQNGPFHRWRSLTFSAQSLCPFFSPDGFPNLESLTILPCRAVNVVTAISLTTTSKLRTLDISRSGTSDQNIDYLYGAMLHRISRLVLGNANVEGNIVTLPPFSANIIDIEAQRRSTHPFPHVKTYKLTHGIFRADHIIDLQRLTTLIITGPISVHHNCHLVLPSLRSLVCAAIFLKYKATLDAPVLEALEFRDEVNSIPNLTRSRFGPIRDVLAHPGYHLSPTKSLLLDFLFPSDLIITMMTRYSRLEKVVIRVIAEVTVRNLTVALSSGDTNRTGIICSQLTDLRLRISQEYRDSHTIEWWKEQAARIVEGRRGLSAALHVYGAWDEGETFTLLA